MKVNINNLPDGYKIVNGKVVKTMALGGVPRTKANLEAERGETALTDLDNDGVHELYTIGGERHHSGGTPLNLPEQSFIFSDTSKMKFDKKELAELGLESKKKQTPAWASKKFQLNDFIRNQAEEHSDHITDKTSELMLEKNKLQLSKVAFMQEAKKDFMDEEGNITVPLAAYPFLISKGINPEEFVAKLEEIKAAKEGVQQAPMQGQEEREQVMQQSPQLQNFTGPPQQQGMHQMPDGSMMAGATHSEAPQQMMARYGGDPFATHPLGKFVYGGDLPGYQGDNGSSETNPAHGQPGHVHEEGEAEFGHGEGNNPSMQCYIDENGNEICDGHERASSLSGAFSGMTSGEDFDIARQVWIDRYNNDASEEGSSYVTSENPDELYDNFYRYNEFLQQIQSHGLEMPEKESSGLNCGGKRCDGKTFRNGKTAAEMSKELGYEDLFFEDDGVTPTTTPTKMFQGMYRSMGNLKNEGDESTRGLFSNFAYSPQGGGWGENSAHRLGDLDVSSVDGIFGTTTYGQYLGVDNNTPEPVNDCENRTEKMTECSKRNTMQGGVQTRDGITTKGPLEGNDVKWFWNDQNCACEQGPGDFTPPDVLEPKPWVQDQNNLNQAMMAKGMRENFFPMQQSFNYSDADMVSHDPLTAIHASNSLAGSIASNPTTSAAEKAMLFDKAAGSNRQAIQDTQNADVAAYNLLSKYNTANRGKVDNLNMQAKDQYVDEVNTVLHNRINTDIADNENINRMNNNLISNMATTHTQNSLYPNYNIDPTTGGLINFTNAKAYQDEINPSSGSVTDQWLADYKNLRDTNVDITHEEAIDILNKNTVASTKAKKKNRPSGYPIQTGAPTGTPAKYGTETVAARKEDLLRSKRELRKWILGI